MYRSCCLNFEVNGYFWCVLLLDKHQSVDMTVVFSQTFSYSFWTWLDSADHGRVKNLSHFQQWCWHLNIYPALYNAQMLLGRADYKDLLQNIWTWIFKRSLFIGYRNWFQVFMMQPVKIGLFKFQEKDYEKEVGKNYLYLSFKCESFLSPNNSPKLNITLCYYEH